VIPLDLAQLRDPCLIVEAIYAGVKRELDDKALLSYLGQGLADDFRGYYSAHTRLLRCPRYFRYLHAQKLETLVREILKRSKSGNPVRILDVGCGMGSQSIAMGLLGAEVHGIDIDARSILVAQRRCSWYETRLGQGLNVTFGCNDAGRMGELLVPLRDVVFSQGSVVFFHPIDGFLEAARRFLRPGGSLIIACVNIVHPLNSIGFFLHTGRLRFRFETHRPLTPRQMRGRLQQNGFEVKLMRGYGYVLPFVVERSESIHRWIVGMERLIPAQLSYVTGLTYLMVGEKG
jgi:2-polyprenyl-3-methyl-5-hydroxy-6-metoxy-1,4-benzoquinol methylase